MDGRNAALAKMKAAGINDVAIEVFSAYYTQLEDGASGLIRESDIEPLVDVDHLDEVDAAVSGAATPGGTNTGASNTDSASAAITRTVIIKLNGGLGTSMGMTKAKSLLPVRDGMSFLDITVRQVLAARARYGARLPLLFMNSFSTSKDTMAALAAYPELPIEGIPLEFVQSAEPKLRRDDLTPVEWPKDPELEWCPPGHGDLYPSLLASGILDQLIVAGFTQACVGNSDNLGGYPSAQLAAWFESSSAPYAAELCLRTPMDRKGGHLAIRRRDGRLILRDTAQTAPEDMAFFTDETVHRFFHTNNLWFNLIALRDVLAERDGVMGLPLIRNDKTVDPRDKASIPVIQIESAMGAAIEVFDGATAIVVPRSRFLPVKTTNELMLVRSDAYDLTDEYRLVRRADADPVVSLDGNYTTITQFDERFPSGVPSLVEAMSLTVTGDWTFGADVVVSGDVTLAAPDDAPRAVPDGTRLASEE